MTAKKLGLSSQPAPTARVAHRPPARAVEEVEEVEADDDDGPWLDAMPGLSVGTAHPALRQLELGELRVERVAGARAYLVAEARSEGASWAQIGAVLGITRQSAHARFRWGVRRSMR